MSLAFLLRNTKGVQTLVCEILRLRTKIRAPADNATTPIKFLAQNRIYKKYRRIVRRGSRTLDNIEAEHLHTLRIECKKLRYLMSFFRIKPKLKYKAKGLVKKGKSVNNSIKGPDFENLDLLPSDFSHRFTIQQRRLKIYRVYRW